MLTQTSPLVEVAVDSVAAAEAAALAGADRLELCASLEVGGLTPTAGSIEGVRKAVSIPVFAMIRLRAGGFEFAEVELTAMLRDVEVAIDAGADGIVFGALNGTGRIDRRAVEAVVGRAGDAPVTFHRAFDLVADRDEALAALIELGAARVLTSGGAETAFEGRAAIGRQVERAGSRIGIIAGAGVVGDQVVELCRATGVAEIHLAGVRRVSGAGPPGFGAATAPDPDRVRAVLAALGRP